MHDKANEQKAAQQDLKQDWAGYTDMSVGEILSRTRAYYGLTIEDVEKALRIRSSQLLALEEGAIEKLPGRVYAIGFVRAYAEFLGLDGDKMVHLFKAQLVGNKPRPELSMPAPASESKTPNPFILLGSFACLCLVIGLFMVMSGGSDTHQIPDVPATMKMEAVAFGPPTPTAIGLAEIEPAAGTQPPENRVTINVVDNAWVEIRNKEGKVILSRVLKQGDSYLVPNEQGLVMDTGNIGALEFTIDGAPIDKLGEIGDVRRSVSLDPEEMVAPPEAEATDEQTTDPLLDGSPLDSGSVE